MAADNALSLRLDAYVKVQQSYAAALRGKQLVPTVVIGNSGSGKTTSATALIDLLTAKTAKELAVDLQMSKTPTK
jgi:ABC-type dipeptide/oligopeptide/nickel transport system ATPase component